MPQISTVYYVTDLQLGVPGCSFQETVEDFLIQFIKEINDYGNGFEIAIDEKALKDEATRKQLYSILDYFKPSSQNTLATCDADLSVKFAGHRREIKNLK